MKKCFKCSKIKPLVKFYIHPRMKDGHLNKCISCAKKDVSNRYFNPEFRGRIVAYEKARFKDPERKKKLMEYQRKRRLKFKGKFKARSAVGNAIASGKITRLPCEVCGEKAQAHHSDYRKKLSVKWLCFKHHREKEHGQITN